MIWIIVIAGIIGVLLLVLFIGYVYEAGREDGRREQRREMNRAMDEIRQRGLLAQRDIDYLYERARWQITREDRSQPGPRE